jgi:hypothetical protein
MASHTTTLILLLAAATLELVMPRSDADLPVATQLLAPADAASIERLELDRLPVYRCDNRQAIFFETAGKQGLIRGVILVQDDRILRLQLLKCREGLCQREFYQPAFLAAFSGKPAKPPVDVAAVSGATISSQILRDAINERLKRVNSGQRRVETPR